MGPSSHQRILRTQVLYKVQTVDGVVYRRTRLHLKPYKPQGNRLKKPAQQLPGNKTSARPQRNRHPPVKLDL